MNVYAGMFFAQIWLSFSLKCCVQIIFSIEQSLLINSQDGCFAFKDFQKLYTIYRCNMKRLDRQ